MNVLADQPAAAAELSDYFHFYVNAIHFFKRGDEERPQLVTM